MEDTERIAKRFAKYAKDPVLYAKEILGFDTLKEWQIKALGDIAKCDRVAIKGANGVGKGVVLSIAALWFFDTRPYAKVPCTSGSARQVRFSLWSEIGKLAAQSKLRDSYNINQSDILRKGHEASWFLCGFSTDEAGRAEGWHSQNLLFIIDEARAVPDEIFQASFKAATQPGNKIIVASIPGEASGMFHAIFTRLNRSWRLHTVPAAKWKFNGYRALYPDLVSQKSIDEKLEIEGQSSPFFRSSVLAEFVQNLEDALIPTTLILKARTNELVSTEMPVHGLDIARYGRDSSCLCTRSGPCILGFKQQKGLDLVSCASWAKLETQGRALFLDECGIGAGVLDTLRAKGIGNVRGINVATAARDPERFTNLRAELYWKLRERFEKKLIDLSRLDQPVFDKLQAQLASIRYKFKAGKVLIESKEDSRKRGLPSPDLADALVLSFAGESTSTYTGPIAMQRSVIARDEDSNYDDEPSWSEIRKNRPQLLQQIGFEGETAHQNWYW